MFGWAPPGSGTDPLHLAHALLHTLGCCSDDAGRGSALGPGWTGQRRTGVIVRPASHSWSLCGKSGQIRTGLGKALTALAES